MKTLAYILATITQHNRQKMVAGVDFEWSSKSWTHNIFRVFELIFGRREGIRHEMSVYHIEGISTYYAHSWEAFFALAEQYIRDACAWRPTPIRVWVPLMETPQGFPVPASPFLLAVAFDVFNSGAHAAGGNVQWTHTCTGSNLKLFSIGLTNGTFGTPTYNAVNMTQIESNGSTFRQFYLDSPATGANTLNMNMSGGSESDGCSSSYTGCATGIDNHTNATTGSTTMNQSLTPVASNCWIVTGGYGNASFSSGNGNTTVRGQQTPAGLSIGIADTNGAVNGSTTMSLTTASGMANMLSSSIAPLVTANKTNFLAFM